MIGRRARMRDGINAVPSSVSRPAQVLGLRRHSRRQPRLLHPAGRSHGAMEVDAHEK